MIDAATASLLRGGLGASKAATVEGAEGRSPQNLEFAIGDVRDWQAEHPVDVIVCNAVLQWVPGHDKLL